MKPTYLYRFSGESNVNGLGRKPRFEFPLFKGGFAFGKDGLHAVSGATYSSTAILNGINAVGKAFNELKRN